MAINDNPPSDWGSLPPEAVTSIRRAIANGIADGIREAAADADLMRSIVDQIIVAAREEVATTSGRWLWSGLSGALSRLAWWLLIASGILALGGGWGGVAAFFKAGPKP